VSGGKETSSFESFGYCSREPACACGCCSIRVVLARGGRQLCRCRRGVRPFHRSRGCAKGSQKHKLTALPGSTERQALLSLFAAQTSAVGSPQGATDVARERLGTLLVPHSSRRMRTPAPVLPMPLTSHALHRCSRSVSAAGGLQFSRPHSKIRASPSTPFGFSGPPRHAALDSLL
jgi:hypothetical protein